MLDDLLDEDDMVNRKCKRQGRVNKDPIQLPDGEVVEWKDASENGIGFISSGSGLQHYYDGSGYVIRIDYSKTRTEYIE